jgi:hypothetical protein
MGPLARSGIQFKRHRAFQLAFAFKLHFSLNDWIGTFARPERRARRSQSDSAQTLRTASSICHRGQVVKECLVLSLLLMLGLMFKFVLQLKSHLVF